MFTKSVKYNAWKPVHPSRVKASKPPSPGGILGFIIDFFALLVFVALIAFIIFLFASFIFFLARIFFVTALAVLIILFFYYCSCRWCKR